MLQFSHLLQIGLRGHARRLLLLPLVMNPLLLPAKLLDNLFICLRAYGNHTPQRRLRGDSGQELIEFIPADRLKFLCLNSQPVLRQEAGDYQPPVFKKIVVRVNALPRKYPL